MSNAHTFCMLSLFIKLELNLVISLCWLDDDDDDNKEEDDDEEVEDNDKLFKACSLYCGSTRCTGLLMIGKAIFFNWSCLFSNEEPSDFICVQMSSKFFNQLWKSC